MKNYDFKIDPLTGEEFYEVHLRNALILADPLLNKGAAFTEEERSELGLFGLLPMGVSTIEGQVQRALESYRRKQDDLEKYLFLLGLLNRNETLFYRLLTENLDEMVPIVYTPTVGQACQMMSHIMRRPRGVYISPLNIARIDDIFQSLPRPDTKLIVVTDGERILGLGDLGVDGMGIPVGKVALYVAAGGLHPSLCLPVCIDAGTNNERLLKDDLYMGYRHPRLEGDEYYKFLERFVIAVKRNFPGCLLQWEDFAKHKAFNLLDRYRERILSFDDDIQGTGSTACATFISAMRRKKESFKDQTFVICGMGQAGSGIADCIRAILMEEGLTKKEACLRIFAIDKPGLLMEDTPGLEEQQKSYAKPRSVVAGWKLANEGMITLEDVVRNAKATFLVGVTAQRGLFSKEILEQVGRNTETPVILALSNPTAKAECTPEEAIQATGGRAIVATGSPFKPVNYEGREISFSQCNNMYIFPGVGVGALVAQATKVTDEMFIAGSKAISAMVTDEQLQKGMMLPEMKEIRRASFEVALAVAKEARETGIGRQLSDSHLMALIAKAQWEPNYFPYRSDRRRLD
ncbi:MAG TPA: NAD-dependent malic enzyme [Acidobacteriota bacterium]|jgi:malate dehydrogenase (oxaloacetate-decarboxylating)|nr:NAD-dependent malic enzyme [Acidobacteriota bacterium]HQO19693.1 NAD-dependent malic enzyme [Acidobacteriota bacterium]HQQ46538.1 NAD-dependent malic enzyme [Acidobacteriota bacterium]